MVDGVASAGLDTMSEAAKLQPGMSLLPLGFASFLAFGVVLVLLGANQAELARDLGLDLSRTGMLNAALAMGIGVGVAGAGPVFDRHPRRPLFLAASLLSAGALLTVERGAGFGRLLVHVTLAGLGCGAYDTLLNAAVIERYRQRAPRPMSALHSAATLGAVLGPPLVGWLAAGGDWAASFRWTGAGHLLLAVGSLFVRFPDPPRERPAVSPISRALVPFAVVAFAYVGIEASLTIFAVPYAVAGLGLGAERGRVAISGFWLGLMAGRMALLAVRGSIGAGVLGIAGVIGGAALGLGAAAGWPGPVLLLGAVGLAIGVVYPVMIALAGDRFPEARGTAAGLAAAAGAAGGFLVPWLHGAIGDAIGVRAAVGGLAFWCLVIAVAGLVARARRAD